jgi:hypothetical protein
MRALRWMAIAIACGAIWDPTVARTRVVRPPIDVTGTAERHALETRLAREGFPVNSGAAPVAFVTATDRPPVSLPGVPLWALDVSRTDGPNVRIVRAAAGGSRLPGQAARIVAELDARGVGGDTTELRLEQDGVVVASSRHRWTLPRERWNPVLEFLPPDSSPVTLRLRAIPIGAEPVDDNVADVRVRGTRAPLRVLAYDASVSWAAAFVRRSLEGEPAFAVAARQRVSRGVATRAGQPPEALARSSLAPFEAVIVGSPDSLSRAEVDVLRWFVEERGGLVAFISDRRPTGAYTTLLGLGRVEERVLRQPIALSGEEGVALRASELLLAHTVPPGASVLARAGSDPVVVAMPRGEGRVVFFGAVDAWRSRAADDGAFARFWQRTLIGAAAAAPPRLLVTVEPALIRPGERVCISARLRATELASTAEGAIAIPPAAAHIVTAGAGASLPVRLWPTAEPGAYQGEWTASGEGDGDVTVTIGDLTADATVRITDQVAHATSDDPEGLALAARASGGDVHPISEADALVSSLASRFPSRPVRVSTHPMRSPWWLLPFAGALCVEWAWRRKRGLS